MEFYDPQNPTAAIQTFEFLRQQKKKLKAGAPNFSLADFVAPKDSGLSDSAGAFVVTMGQEVDDWATEFEKAGDDYSSIMVKALGDRMAEAYAR